AMTQTLLLDRSLPPTGRFRKRRFAFFSEVADLRPGMSVLDLGGTPKSVFFRGRDDLDVTYLNISAPNAPLTPGHTYCQADARHLPFADGVFDVVFSNSLLEHVPRQDWRQVAREMKRVGRFLFV